MKDKASDMYLSLTGMLKQVNDLPVRGTADVAKILSTMLADIEVTVVKRLTIRLCFKEQGVCLYLHRQAEYNGMWLNAYIQGARRDVTLDQYVKHVKRVANRDYEDNRFLPYGYSKKFVDYVTSSLRHLEGSKLDAITRLSRSYDLDIKAYARLVYKIRLAEIKQKKER